MGEAFTVEFSANLIKQLANEEEKSKKKTKRTKSRIARERQQPQANTNRKQISSESETTNVSPPLAWQTQSPLFFPVSPPPPSAIAELEAIRSTVRESEKVLEKLQKEEEFKVQQVTQRAKDLHENEFKLPEHKAQSCLTEKGACFDCYKENVKDPLRCADLVKNYADCVRSGKQQLSSAHN